MTLVRPLSYLVLGVGAVLLLQACKKDNNGIADLAGANDLAPPPGDLSVVDQAVEQDMTPPPDLLPPPCTSEVTSCAGLCGKVIDSCTGAIFQCGGCDGTQVCDLDTHTCIEPKLDCEDFAAECGEIKNSCGKRFDCGNCASGKECDRDTRKCVDCVAVTCDDLGYECGRAWLGCGSPDTDADYTDCGECGDGTVCNEGLHICEPNCTPPQTTDEINAYCAAQRTNNNIECGYTTDGCGGTLYCGDCEAGKKCGRRGVPNHCDPDEVPVECQALGKECGTITSKCDAQIISCGDCPDGEVCNDNGICGPPCQPKICAEVLVGGIECGNFPDDGCSGTLTCSCGSGQLCGGDGKCAPILTCASYTMGDATQPCSNDPSSTFPKGDGTNLECNCDGGLFCVDGTTVVSGDAAGTCCQDTGAKCSGTGGLNGPCQAVNSCTGQMSNCCTGNNKCDTGAGKCVDKCAAADATGAAGKPCSTTGRAYFDGATCNCGGGLTCIGETGSAPGTCCQNTGGSCSGANGPCSVTNSCTSVVTQCCTGNLFCDTAPNPDVCKVRNTCGTFNANGNQGNPCSRGPSSSFPSNDGGPNLTCDCGTGLACVTGTAGSYDIVPTDGTTGTCQQLNVTNIDPDNDVDCRALGGYWNGTSCCFNSTCAGNQCGIQIANACTSGTNAAGQAPPAMITCRACACSDYSMPNGANEECTVNGTQTIAPSLTCGCTNGNTCRKTNANEGASEDGRGKCCPNGQVLDPSDACVAPNSCSSLGKATNNGPTDAGKQCNDNNVYNRNDGGSTLDFSCRCGTGSGWANQVCSGDTATQDQNGSCTCAPKTACTQCADGGQSNGCGGTIPACCGSGDFCKNTSGSTFTCCEPLFCPANYECGTFLDTCTGTNRSCGTCTSDKYCDGSRICQPKATCENMSPANTGAIGSPCNEFNRYDRGNGEKYSCGCDTSGGKTNNTCEGDSASANGTCTCVPTSCTILGAGTWPDGCGAQRTCGS